MMPGNCRLHNVPPTWRSRHVPCTLRGVDYSQYLYKLLIKCLYVCLCLIWHVSFLFLTSSHFRKATNHEGKCHVQSGCEWSCSDDGHLGASECDYPQASSFTVYKAQHSKRFPAYYLVLLFFCFVFQIKQRLVDHKMAQNVTVKWRVEPDGVVFQKKNENNTTL